MSIVNVTSKLYSTQNFVFNLLKNSNCWIDFSDSSTYTTTGTGNLTLASVTDKSNDAVTVTVTGTPSFDEASLSMFNLSSTSNYLSIPYSGANTTTNSETVFLVTSQTSGSGAPGYFGTATSGARYARVGPDLSYGRAGASLVGTSQTSTNVEYGKILVISYVLDRTSLRIFYNGKLGGFGTVSFTANSTPTRIGQAYLNTNILMGNIFEIIFFNEGMADDQRQLIEYYLMKKWTIQNTLSSPLGITGCTLWLDGNDNTSVTYSSGTNISQWNDKSGNNYHAVQGTAARQPTYNSTTKAVNFVAANTQFMTTTSPYTGSANNEHVYIVFRTNGIANANLIGTTDTARGRQIRSAGTRLQIFNGSTASISGLRTTLNTTDKFVVEFVNVTGRCLMNINKAIDGNSAKIGFAAGTWNQVIGGATTAGAVPYDGDIYEVVIYNRALTGSERQSVMHYLITKWNISAGPTLLNNQPYTSIPPYLRLPLPLDVSGCNLWLDAADASTITLSGSNVTSWRDKSGSGNNASGGTSPTYSNNGVVFNGSTHYLTTNYSASLTNETFFAVLQPTGSLASGKYNTIVASSANGGKHIFTNATAINVNSQSVAAGPGGGTLTLNQTVLVEYSRNSLNNTVILYTNGSSIASGTLAAYTASLTTWIGRWPGSTVDNWQGPIYELIGYNRTLSIGERQLIEGYLCDKWKIKSTLPATHSFKNELALSPGFDPRKFSLSLWLDAWDTRTISLSGSAVTQWNDKSGTNNFLANGAPVYTTTPGGKPAVYFSSNNLQMYSSSNSSTTVNVVRTIFLVGQAPNAGSSIIRVGTGTHSTAATPTAFGFDINPPAALVYVPYVYTASDNSFSATVTTLSTFYAYADGTNIGGSYNYGTIQTKARTLNTTAGPWYIGYRDDTNGCIDAYVCEFLHFNAVLNTFQRQQVEGYLAWKWGTQSSLPSTHPYAKYPPY